MLISNINDNFYQPKDFDNFDNDYIEDYLSIDNTHIWHRNNRKNPTPFAINVMYLLLIVNGV